MTTSAFNELSINFLWIPGGKGLMCQNRNNGTKMFSFCLLNDKSADKKLTSKTYNFMKLGPRHGWHS